MRFTLSDGTIVYAGKGFAFGGVQYGADWFATMNADQKAAIGLTQIVDDPQPDGRFYYVSADQANPGKWISTPKPIAGIQAMFTARVDAYVASTLAQTDWMRVRAIDDGGKPMPANIATYRNAVRNQGNALNVEVAAITDFNTLIAWAPHDWPVDPNAPASP